MSTTVPPGVFSGIEDRMMQGDTEILARRTNVVRVDERVEVLVRCDRSVQKEVVLAVDTAPGHREDALGYQFAHCRELDPIDLSCQEARRDQPAVTDLRAGVTGRCGELANQIRTQRECKGSSSVSENHIVALCGAADTSWCTSLVATAR